MCPKNAASSTRLLLSLKVEINPGQTQLEACWAIATLARRLGITVYGFVNDHQVFASPDDSPESVYERLCFMAMQRDTMRDGRRMDE